MLRRFRPLALSLTAIAVGCISNGPAQPRPDRIEPSSGPADQPTPGVISGRFSLDLVSNFDDHERSTLSSQFSAELGTTALLDVTYVDRTTLTATVPAGMTPGRVDLRVTDPQGRSATRTDAFEVEGTARAASPSATLRSRVWSPRARCTPTPPPT